MDQTVDDSRQHEFFEVIERLLANHDDCQLYTQFNQTAGCVTLPCRHMHNTIIHCESAAYATRKLSSIKNWGQTDCIRVGIRVWRLGLWLSVTFNLSRIVVMTHTHAKGKGQRSVDLKDRVETEW